MNWIRAHLIPDWRSAWRFLSVQAAAIVGIVAAAYDYMPSLHDYLPEGWVKWAVLIIIVARIVHQPSLQAKEPTDGA